MKNFPFTRTVGTIAAALSCGFAFAQTSTLDLKNACELSPGNIVRIDGPMLIDRGATAQAPQVVTTGCTLVLGQFGKFEANNIGMRFAGPLSIQGAHMGFAAMSNTSLAASSVSVSLLGSDSVLIMGESNLQATAGNVSVTLGPIGKIEFVDIAPFQPYQIKASGSVAVSGGEKFTFIMKGGNLEAGAAMTIDMAGNDTLLLADSAGMLAGAGALNVNASMAKATVTLNQGTYRGASVNVGLAGADSSLSIKDADIRATTGSVSVDVGGNNGGGKMEVSQSRFNAPGAVSLFSSRGGNLGFVAVDNVDLNGAGGVRVETGAGGSTFMKNSRGSSATFFYVRTGLGGLCLTGDNLITSPDQRLCF